MPPLKAGDPVRFKGKKEKSLSRKGKVSEKLHQPRSYNISTDKETVFVKIFGMLLNTSILNIQTYPMALQIEYHTPKWLNAKHLL